MPDLSSLITLDTLVSFLALTFLEVVLGVDNIVFVALAADTLPPKERGRGRQLGLWLAMGLRVLMLLGVVWITRLDLVLFPLPNGPFTVKDAVLAGGGLFLLYKSSTEIHDELEPAGQRPGPRVAGAAKRSRFWGVVAEIGVINIVFSLDSVITAVGMSGQIPVMVAAVVVATLLMMVAAAPGGGLHRAPAQRQGAGPVLHPADRHGPDRRGHRLPRAPGLSLFRHGLLVVCGDAEHLSPAVAPPRMRGCECWLKPCSSFEMLRTLNLTAAILSAHGRRGSDAGTGNRSV